jgi:hypothetical protein
MDDWELADLWDWDDEEEDEVDFADFVHDLAEEMAARFFLSNNNYLPSAGEEYQLGYLEAGDWWPLVNQLAETVDLETLLELAEDLDDLLKLPGLPTELLENPGVFLESVLQGDLPPEPSGRRVGSRKLVKIALLVAHVLNELPESARAAVRAWADVHRRIMAPFVFDEYARSDLADFLTAENLPPAMSGFSMMIALTLMLWPKRAEGLPLPSRFADPELFGEVLVQWEALPDIPTVTPQEAGQAEALFAQGQLAYTLAQMGTVDLVASEGVEEQDVNLAYSRLSRAILWVHNQCRHCSEREGVTCRAASDWPERPVPLLDVATEIANTGRIAGCIKAD